MCKCQQTTNENFKKCKKRTTVKPQDSLTATTTSPLSNHPFSTSNLPISHSTYRVAMRTVLVADVTVDFVS